jgi:anti-sigma factor RsiW
MDVLISFYIDNELSQALRKQVEEHLKSCATCSAKYEIITSMISDMKSCCKTEGQKNNSNQQETKPSAYQYQVFKNNLSAYIDNELNDEENLKIKKFFLNNKKARKELEDSFSLRKMMNDSFKKSKNVHRNDFSRNIMKILELEEEVSLGVHPAVKLIIGFMVTVFVLTAIVLMSLNM